MGAGSGINHSGFTTLLKSQHRYLSKNLCFCILYNTMQIQIQVRVTLHWIWTRSRGHKIKQNKLSKRFRMSQIKLAKNNTKMYNTYRVPVPLLFQFSLILHKRNQGVFLLQKVSHSAKPSRSRSKTLLKMLPKILLCSSVCLLVGIFVLVWVFCVFFENRLFKKTYEVTQKKYEWGFKNSHSQVYRNIFTQKNVSILFTNINDSDQSPRFCYPN